MVEPSTPAVAERRTDRRHALVGHARFFPSGGGPELFGGIVDVSARGVRLRVKPDLEASPGDRCHVWLTVLLPGTPPEAPPVRLHGDAIVLRRERAAERGHELAMRFEDPLRVGDAFSPRVA